MDTEARISEESIVPVQVDFILLYVRFLIRLVRIPAVHGEGFESSLGIPHRCGVHRSDP